MGIDNAAKVLNAPQAVGYDRVDIPMSNGKIRSLSRKEFEALPLRERVSYLLEGNAQFFLNGQTVSARDAMKG